MVVIKQRLSKSIRMGLFAAILTIISSTGNADNLLICQIKSLIPSGEGLSCRILQDQINFELVREENSIKAHVKFDYSYDFHFTPADQGWLVSNSLTGDEILNIDMDLVLSKREGTDLTFENEGDISIPLKGKVKKDGEAKFFFYQRPAQVDLEILYKEKEQKASINLYILWLDEIPGYGVYDPLRGAGIVEKFEGTVVPSLDPALSHFPHLTNRDFPGRFPSPKNNFNLPSPQ